MTHLKALSTFGLIIGLFCLWLYSIYLGSVWLLTPFVLVLWFIIAIVLKSLYDGLYGCYDDD